MSSIGQSQDTTPATPVSEKRRQPMVAAQRAEQGLVSGALPNDAETGTTDDKDLSSWHDDRSRKIDRLSHEWACHKGALSDNDAPREKGALRDKRPLHDKRSLHDKWPLCEERPLCDKRPLHKNGSALESEPAARDHLAMPSSGGT
jgi:hypothetical protein